MFGMADRMSRKFAVGSTGFDPGGPTMLSESMSSTNAEPERTGGRRSSAWRRQW